VVSLWEAATGQPLGEPLRIEEPFPDQLSAVAFSADESMLAIGSRDGTIVLWDLVNGVQLGEPLREVQFRGFQFDGDRGPGGQLDRLVFSRDGKTLAAAGEQVVLWDLAKREKSPPLVRDAVNGDGLMPNAYPAFSPDGLLIAVATTDWRFGFETCEASDILVYARGDGGITGRIGLPLVELGINREAVCFTSLAYSPDGTQLAAGTTDKGIMVWSVPPDPPTGPLVRDRFQPPDMSNGRSTAVSSGGSLVAVPASQENAITVWSIADKRPIATLRGHTSPIAALAFSPDGSLLASRGIEEHGIRIWDVAIGEQRLELKADAPLGGSLAFSPDGTVLAAIGGDEDVVLTWTVSDGQPGGSQHTVDGDRLWSLRFSPDGNVLAAGGDKGIYLWDVVGGRARAMLTGNLSSVLCLAFSPDGSMLAAGDKASRIGFWDVATGSLLGSVRAATNRAVPGLGGMEFGVNAVEFMADGRSLVLVAGGQDGAITLWDTSRQRPVGSPLHTRSMGITRVAIGGDGKSVVSASWEGEVLTHDLDVSSWRASACRRANRNLTREEWRRYLGEAEYRPTCDAFPPDPGPPAATPTTVSA
jgi:WD40 repeat protein